MSIVVNSKINAQSFWIGYSTQNLLLSVLLLWPCIFGLIGTFIFVRERIENTYKNRKRWNKYRHVNKPLI